MLVFQPPSSEIQVPCPQTNLPIDIALQTDAESLSKVWAANLHVSCPHCGMGHEFNVRDAYLDYILETAGTKHPLAR